MTKLSFLLIIKKSVFSKLLLNSKKSFVVIKNKFILTIGALIQFLIVLGGNPTSNPPSKRAIQLNNEISNAYSGLLKYQTTNIDTALQFCKILEAYTSKEKDTFLIGEIAIYKGTYMRTLGNTDSSLALTKHALQIAKYPGQLLEILHGHANVLEITGDKDTEKYYLKAVEMADIYGKSHPSKPGLYANYGSFLHKRGRVYDAAIYYEKSIKTTKNSFQLMHILLRLTDIFLTVNNIERANEYILKAVEVTEKNNYKSRNGTVANYYARVLIKRGKLKQAKEELIKSENYIDKFNPKGHKASYFKTKIEYLLAIQDYENLRLILKEPAYAQFHKNTEVLNTKAQLLMQDNQYKKALPLATTLLTKAKEKKNKQSLYTSYKLLSTINDQLNNKSIAFNYLKQADKLKDSMDLVTQFGLVNYLEARYKRKEQDQEIAILDAQNETKTVQISKQQTALIIGGIALALISFLSFLLLRLYKQVKEQKTQITKTLKQKDTLLREIHHRVKNNLQLVSSLLTLQSRSIDDKIAMDAINAGKSRVRSMALIHQDLYNRENLTGIGLKDYLGKLTRELFSTYNVSDKKISLSLSIQDIDLDIDTIIPLGLIINELITNSLKYAFQNKESGELSITLKEEGSELVLIVKDSGPGFDHDSIDTSKSFGSKLIETLTEQLEGTVERKFDQGSEIIIRFSEYKIAA